MGTDIPAQLVTWRRRESGLRIGDGHSVNQFNLIFIFHF